MSGSRTDGGLDASVCERARVARDARFDGRFFTGVLTTGIYCRPICPVRPSRPENVRFYRSAAEAAAAGFRPCLRCRPESSPGAPASRGTAVTVARALRLIDQGALDGAGVESLAERLGVGSRHLGRLFATHLGAAPIQIAQTRRLQLAVKLLEETALPMTEIALAAGFGSVRRFNEVVRAAYGRPPSRLARPRARVAGQPLTLELAFRPPLAWRPLCTFFATRAVAGVESIAGSRYRRTISLGDQHGWLEVQPVKGTPRLRLAIDFPDVVALATIVARVRAMFDLDADPLTIRRDLAVDEILGRRVAAAPGMRVPGAWDGFELALQSVLERELGTAGARSAMGRIVERFGKSMKGGPRNDLPWRAFPDPGTLADARLADVGVPAELVPTLRSLARAAWERSGAFADSGDLDALVRSLCGIPGLEPGTAQLVALRSGHPDAFPHDDVALRRGYAACVGHGRTTPRALLLQSGRWRPWRAYAAVHLWRAAAAQRAPGARRS